MIGRLIDARWPLALGFAVLILLLWQSLAFAGVLPAYLLGPVQIAQAVVETARDGLLLPAVGASILRQATGFALGAAAGALIGLLAGVLRPAEDFFDTLVSLTYPLPKIALFPVAVIWLGFSDTARVLVIALSCFYPAFVNAFAGTRSLDARMLWVARNLEASRWRTYWQVIFRGSLPSVVVGVRISLALSFVLTFATETIGASRSGLGFLIDEGFNNRLFGMMFAGIVGFAVLGFLADQIFMRLAGVLLRGQRTEVVRSG